MVQKYFNLCKSMNDSSLRYNGNHFGTEMHNKNTTMMDTFVQNIVVFLLNAKCVLFFSGVFESYISRKKRLMQ